MSNVVPFYRDLLPPVLEAWEKHDLTCSSMPWFWWGRISVDDGKIPFGEVAPCNNCLAYFWGDGLVDVSDGCGMPTFLCGCCHAQI